MDRYTVQLRMENAIHEESIRNSLEFGHNDNPNRNFPSGYIPEGPVMETGECCPDTLDARAA